VHIYCITVVVYCITVVIYCITVVVISRFVSLCSCVCVFLCLSAMFTSSVLFDVDSLAKFV